MKDLRPKYTNIQIAYKKAMENLALIAEKEIKKSLLMGRTLQGLKLNEAGEIVVGGDPGAWTKMSNEDKLNLYNTIQR